MMSDGSSEPFFGARRVMAWTATIVTIALVCETFALARRGEIAVLDIGQGDAILVTLENGVTMLIDGGPDSAVLDGIGRRLPYGDRSIDLVILTHPNLDHVAGLPEVLRRYDVRRVMLPLVDYPIARYREFLEELTERGIAVTPAIAGTRLAYGRATLTVLWPPEHGAEALIAEDVNNASVVAVLETSRTRVLLTGDMEELVEREMLRRGIDVRAQILKVAHHGSMTSTSRGFLAAVHPEIALISAGRENRFGHPHPSVMERLQTAAIRVLRTDRIGTVALPL